MMKCVMVVDDDRDIRDCVADALQMQGYAVRTATNGKDALEQLKAMDGEPCLVLLDMMMPVMDGAQFLHIVSETRQFAALPVVLVSGHAEGIPGVRRVVRKPVSLGLLLGMVREFCGEACETPARA